MRSERPMIISEIMKTYRVGRSFVDREIKSGRLIAYNPTGRTISTGKVRIKRPSAELTCSFGILNADTSKVWESRNP